MTDTKSDVSGHPSWYVCTVSGEPASKANSRRHVIRHGRSASIKSEKALNYGESFKQKALEQPIDGDVILAVRVWYRSRRPDLDITLIKDLLQGQARRFGGKRVVTFPGFAYFNDRQVKAEFALHSLDKNWPRSHIVVAPLADAEEVVAYMLRGEY